MNPPPRRPHGVTRGPWQNAPVSESAAAANSAIADFHSARRRADLAAVMAQLSGQSDRLLKYDEVRRRLKAVESNARTLEDVPLGAIVGSVGRYQDFNRSFMPLTDADRSRWVGVKLAMLGMEGVPPIEVYRIGDAYFVRDGNHRVSVARQLGATHIHAWVTPVSTRVPFTPDMDQDGLIQASELAEFLEATRLDELRPEADLTVTAPGQYPRLLEHIRVHRYFMGIDENRPVPWEEAVTHFYDTVYLPVVEEIRAHGLLLDFPGRTETDLYLYLSEHRGELMRRFGWELEGPQLAEGLARTRPGSVDERAAGLTNERSLVDSVLLVLTGEGDDADVLRTGVSFAALEGARVYGVAPVAAAGAEAAFAAECRRAGVTGQLASVDGALAREVRERARYVDLVVLATRQGHGPALRPLLRRCPKPRLLAGGDPRPALRPGARPLLAYDGGEKAEEALFAVAYLAVRYELEPVVLHVGSAKASEELLARPREYLRRLGVKATTLSRRGPVAETIVSVAEELGCSLVFLGSYTHMRWLEELMGGVLEQVLEATDLTVLVT